MPRGACLVVFLLALLLGVAINAVRGPRSFADLTGDEPEYVDLATDLARTGDYGEPGRQAYRAPAYPALMALVFRVFGAGVPWARMLQSLLGALLVLLTFRWASALGGRSAGWLAAAMVMFESYWWLNQWSLLQENLAAVLLTGSAGNAWTGWRLLSQTGAGADGAGRRSLLRFGAGGVLFGLSLLTKPLLVPLLAVLCGTMLYALRPGAARLRRSAARGAGAFALAALLVVVPWVLRNASVLGAPVLTTGSGEVFSGSHRPESFSGIAGRGGWGPAPLALSAADSVALARFSPGARELRLDRLHWSAGFHELRAHSAGEIALTTVFKALRAWSPSTYFAPRNGAERIAKAGLVLGNALILAGFVLALARRSPGWWIGALAGLSLLATTALFWGSIRFRYPLQGIIVALSATWWVATVGSRARRRASL